MDCKKEGSAAMPKSRRPLCLLGPFQPYGLKVTAWRRKDGEGYLVAENGAGNSLAGSVERVELPYRYCLFDVDSLRDRSGTLEQAATGESFWNHDEELFIHGNTVVWSVGHQVRKRFSASTAIMEAKWCRLIGMREPLLCVLHSDSLSTYTPSGEMNAVPLQYSVASIWPLPCGLLLQRGADISHLVSSGANLAIESPTPHRTWNCEGFREGAFGASGSVISPGALHSGGGSSVRRCSPISLVPVTHMSSLFHLHHPLEEPQAVQVEEGGKWRLFSAMEEKIVWSSLLVPYVVTYHTGKRQHTVWQVKAAPPNFDSDSLTYGHALEKSGSVCLQRVWTKKGGHQQASETILATDEDGVYVLCLLMTESQQLFSLRLHSSDFSSDLSVKPKLEVAWSIPAISAAPVVATRPRLRNSGVSCYDILTLSRDGKLSLHIGRHQICCYYLSLSSVQSLSSTSWSKDHSENKLQDVTGNRQDESLRIVGLCDAVQGRVNVVTDSGKMYRCAVGFTPSSTLTILCMNALAQGLRPALHRWILSRLLEREFPILNALHVSTAKAGGRLDLEWAAFSRLLTEIIRDMPGEVLTLSKLASSNQTKETSSSWEYLLQSSMHQSNLANLKYKRLSIPEASVIAETSPLLGQSLAENDDAETAVCFSVMLEILEVLHAVYEDCKLDTLRWRELWQLAATLSTLAAAAGELDYVDQYARDFPMAVQAVAKPLESSRLRTETRELPNLFKWLEDSLRTKRPAESSKYLPDLLTKAKVTCVQWSRKVVGFYEVLAGGLLKNGLLPSGVQLQIAAGSATSAEQRTVLAMVAEEFGLPDLDRLPPGISLPLRHALDECREVPPGDWPVQAYVLVGRDDLAYRHLEVSIKLKAVGNCGGRSSLVYPTSVNNTDDVWMVAPYMLHLRPVPILPASCDPNDVRDPDDQVCGGEELHLVDGMEHISTTSAPFRFGRDLRLNEVRRLLGSSKPVAVQTTNAPDVSDPDIANQQQSQLWQLAQRTTGLPLGRGAFTLATSRPILTEALPIPKLVLAGRLPSQHDATVNLDPNTGNLADVTSWPEFHNGVAAGLRLAPGQPKISRTWIVYNKPDEPNYSHAGLLMALGLHNHLGVLAATDVYRYLSQEHEATTVGVLLGMSTAYRGTMDPGISKMLYLHIPTRHPPTFPELELPTLVQSAALLAVGLLYQGSAHRLTTEILLAEIGRKPGGDNVLDREGYALAAGFALGLVTLGRGRDAWGLADLHIEDRLRHYMSGGGEPTDERLQRFDGTMPPSNLNSRSFEDQSQFIEGSTVSLDVTAPGAILALGLMFLKTNCEVVAARLAIPDTHFALEYVRPDFILLRLVARSIILWDSVQATEEWIQAQIPGIVKEAMATFIKGDGPPELPLNAEADIEALAQANVYILAGACLSIGLKYAGTASAEAQLLLRQYALYFYTEKYAGVPHGAATSANNRRQYVDRGTLETCLNVAVLSLSLVMAGTGHLETFRLLRFLRRRTDSDGAITFGNHMAISMAIGFLFLGGGGLTFATDNGAVAALLIALYPRFPVTPSDHRCHLQAFRHLYVLATEARSLQTVDVDTQLPVYVPIEMTLKESVFCSETLYSHVTPCILPERHLLKRVRVCGPRYWPQDIKSPAIDQLWWASGASGGHFLGGTLYVKRKVGACSYADDPIGCRSLLSRAFHKDSDRSYLELSSNCEFSKVDQLVSTFSADPSMLAFAQLFCKRAYNSKSHGKFNEFCLLALFKSVSSDRPALLQTYLSLYTAVEALVDRASGQGSSVNCMCSDSLSVQSLKVAVAYCDLSGQKGEGGGPLVQRTFVAALAKRVDDVLSSPVILTSEVQAPESMPYNPELCSYLENHEFPSFQSHQLELESKRIMPQGVQVRCILFSCFLCWCGIPQPWLLTAALQHLAKALPGLQNMAQTDSHASLPSLALVLPGTPLPGLLHINRCLHSSHFSIQVDRNENLAKGYILNTT